MDSRKYEGSRSCGDERGVDRKELIMSSRTSFRMLVVVLLGLACFAHGDIAHAGLGSALKKKIADKAAKKAEGALDKPGDAAQQAPAAGDPNSAAGGAPSAGAGGGSDKVSAVSTKFDFVPGDSVMFADDFTQDELGEFPARWKLLQGTFEVAEQEGERWLRCTSNDGHIRMKVPPSLPEFWTLEFDGSHLDAAGNTLTVTALSASGATVWEAVFPYSGHNLMFRSGQVFSDTPFESGPISGRHHFMFMARGTGLKVYVDRDRAANVPDVTESGVAAEIDFRLWSTEKPMLANVRFAEGCKPAKDELDSGRLVTYGIRFATGSDVVMPESAPVLRQVSAYMEQHAEIKLKITGHTDNVGAPASNLDLSKRRAASVAKVLAEQFGIAAGRFTTDGKGDTQTVASNAKPEGRAMNRRVEFAKL
jgi:outer membrane protein OmpA-like peptidoglycan-associated protein